MAKHEQAVLDVRNLCVQFDLEEGLLKAVDGVDFSVGSNEILGVIGESGCGKSVTAQSILRIVPDPGRIVSGEVLFTPPGGTTQDLAKLHSDGRAIESVRGKEISMIFQEPMTSLSPVHSIGAQISEAILLHITDDKKEARERTLDMINKVGISSPEQRINEYPHQLSGGMRQRAMIAMALSCNPALLVADEPTTALDVTVQAQILDLMQNIQSQFGMSILYITHDLGVIAEISDHVTVMYLGKAVEQAEVAELFRNPLHPYTRQLLKSVPELGRKVKQLETIEGNVPIPINLPIQCGFCSRCPVAIDDRCDRTAPALVDMGGGHSVRCFLHSEESEKVTDG